MGNRLEKRLNKKGKGCYCLFISCGEAGGAGNFRGAPPGMNGQTAGDGPHIYWACDALNGKLKGNCGWPGRGCAITQLLKHLLKRLSFNTI